MSARFSACSASAPISQRNWDEKTKHLPSPCWAGVRDNRFPCFTPCSICGRFFVLVPDHGLLSAFTLRAVYAVYFPELFPTYLRSTGTSFLLTTSGRFIAAFGPLVKIGLNYAFPQHC